MWITNLLPLDTKNDTQNDNPIHALSQGQDLVLTHEETNTIINAIAVQFRLVLRDERYLNEL